MGMIHPWQQKPCVQQLGSVPRDRARLQALAAFERPLLRERWRTPEPVAAQSEGELEDIDMPACWAEWLENARYILQRSAGQCAKAPQLRGDCTCSECGPSL